MRRIITGGALALLGASCLADTIGLSALTRVTVEPDRISFEGPGVPCGPYEQMISILNGSDVELRVDEIRVGLGLGGAFSVEVSELPASVPSGEALRLTVRFFAEAPGVYDDRVIIRASLAGQPLVRTVPVRGLIADGGRFEDRFVQNQTSDADILFVIDNSCSMVPEQRALADNFRSFIQIADSGLLNFHIAVTTTDVSDGDIAAEGRFVPLDGPHSERVVSRASNPTPLDHFERISAVGVEGSGEERGIHAAHLALTPELLEDHNAGFLRDHARLAVVFVSDEQDQSPENVEFYAEALAAAKDDDPGRVSVSAIVGDPPMGCTGPGGTATEGTRYIELVDRFQGVARSICTTQWGQVLAQLSSVAFGLRASFPLTAIPRPDELEVRVDGDIVERTDARGRVQWRYLPRTNAVLFEPAAIPGPGAAVVIAYGVSCS